MSATNSNPEIAYIFDVDGVLTNLVDREVVDESLINEIIKLLENKIPVGLITGRSIPWVRKNVLDILIEKIKHKMDLKRLMVIGEKGGTWLVFDKHGNSSFRKAKFYISKRLERNIKRVIENKYSDVVQFDDSKRTMITAEMKYGYDLNSFTKKQKEMIQDFQKIILDTKIKNLRVESTSIAVDVESIYFAKPFSIEKFLGFLRKRKIYPKKFITFGDSKSDFEMADELERRGKKVEMIYVGDREKLGEVDKDYPVEYIGGFTKGTLEYLQRQTA